MDQDRNEYYDRTRHVVDADGDLGDDDVGDDDIANDGSHVDDSNDVGDMVTIIR